MSVLYYSCCSISSGHSMHVAIAEKLSQERMRWLGEFLDLVLSPGNFRAIA